MLWCYILVFMIKLPGDYANVWLLWYTFGGMLSNNYDNKFVSLTSSVMAIYTVTSLIDASR